MADGAGMESFSSSSSSASTSMRPTFDQLNAELFSRGFVPSPLDVGGMRSSSVNQLADALHAMLSQRQQDVEFREAVSAKNRSLASSLERTQRFLAEEKERRLDAERGLEASKAKVGNLTDSLNTSQSALKQAREDVQKSRRDLHSIKAQANQHKVACERQVERLRARFGEESIKAMKSVVPEVYIVPGTGHVSKSQGSRGMERMQLEELEAKRSELLETNRALKRIATEAINAARDADNALVELIRSEEGYRRRLSKLLGSSHGLASSQQSEASLVPHAVLFTRDIFPPLFPLPSDYAGEASRKTDHPAARALRSTVDCIHLHRKTLREAQTERSLTLSETLRTTNKAAAEEASSSSSSNRSSTASASADIDAPASATAFAAARGQPSAYEERKRLEVKLAETLAKLSQVQAEAQAAKGRKGAHGEADSKAKEREAELEKAKEELAHALNEAKMEAQGERQRCANMLAVLEEERRELAKEREELVRKQEAMAGERSVAWAEIVDARRQKLGDEGPKGRESHMATVEWAAQSPSIISSHKRKSSLYDEGDEDDEPVEAPTSSSRAAPLSSSPVKDDVGRQAKRAKPMSEAAAAAAATMNTTTKRPSLPKAMTARRPREPLSGGAKREPVSTGPIRRTSSGSGRGATAPSAPAPQPAKKTVAPTPFPPSKATAKTSTAARRGRAIEPLGVATNRE
ncbi:hypothetical protein FA10DRAFT_268652 [Acaromyces ingoldii]|uniref:Uncharacterized protein n=1 Tax=Acaromyces ingoldii TaxID=215250 RepID=A0A316YGB5_9BASI|nr:hypothetical protein FA10DRAFT_268652 [Acaromyces ingoldii]PWN88457.1 hypothetical protein FA10DRAFT_268652 [Acaromyces ingoldii]